MPDRLKGGGAHIATSAAAPWINSGVGGGGGIGHLT